MKTPDEDDLRRAVTAMGAEAQRLAAEARRAGILLVATGIAEGRQLESAAKAEWQSRLAASDRALRVAVEHARELTEANDAWFASAAALQARLGALREWILVNVPCHPREVGGLCRGCTARTFIAHVDSPAPVVTGESLGDTVSRLDVQARPDAINHCDDCVGCPVHDHYFITATEPVEEVDAFLASVESPALKVAAPQIHVCYDPSCTDEGHGPICANEDCRHHGAAHGSCGRCQVDECECDSYPGAPEPASVESSPFAFTGTCSVCKQLVSDGRAAHRECEASIESPGVAGAPKVTGETSDGYHTFNELYDHRITLFLALCEMVDRVTSTGHVWRSKLHSDGSSFDGWFIMGIGTLPGEQITYHLPMPRWGEADFLGTAFTRAPTFDGHTAADVLARLKARYVGPVPAGNAGAGRGSRGSRPMATSADALSDTQPAVGDNAGVAEGAGDGCITVHVQAPAPERDPCAACQGRGGFDQCGNPMVSWRDTMGPAYACGACGGSGRAL